MDPLTGRHDPAPGSCDRLAVAARGHPPDDRETVADDCVVAFLSSLEESLWILADAQRAPANAFGNAARGHDHVRDLRRMLHRLHKLLSQWEDACP